MSLAEHNLLDEAEFAEHSPHHQSKDTLTENQTACSKINVRQTIVHPSYAISNRIHNDIALVQLQKAVEWSEHIQPACFSNSGFRLNESLVKECTEEDTLQKVGVPNVANIDCHQDKFNAENQTSIVLDGFIRADGFQEGVKDSCGGPLMIKQGDQYVVVGVSNNGIGCHKFPGIYTRVNNHIDWISETIRKNTIL